MLSTITLLDRLYVRVRFYSHGQTLARPHKFPSDDYLARKSRLPLPILVEVHVSSQEMEEVFFNYMLKLLLLSGVICFIFLFVYVYVTHAI